MGRTTSILGGSGGPGILGTSSSQYGLAFPSRKNSPSPLNPRPPGNTAQANEDNLIVTTLDDAQGKPEMMDEPKSLSRKGSPIFQGLHPLALGKYVCGCVIQLTVMN